MKQQSDEEKLEEQGHGEVQEKDKLHEFDMLEKKDSSELWEWTKAIGIAVVIAVVIRISLFAPIVVEGSSMDPTLESGERLIVNKAVYHWSEPERGDIVVFHATESNDWIKRVIGVPGDIVQVKDDTLYINNKKVDEPYLDVLKAIERGTLTHDFYEEVPKGHIFVMGDNRTNSRDSRAIGPIEIKEVFGRAEVIFWPFTELRLVK